MSSFSVGSLDGNKTFTGSVGSSDLTNVYTFNLTAPGKLSSSLTGLNADANLRLLNSSGTVLKSSSAKGISPESINAVSLAAGTYKIQIDRVSGATKYSLSLTSDYARNSLATARSIGALNSTRTFNDFVSSTDLSDYYKFSLSTSSNISASLSGLSTDANLRLLNSGGNILRSSATAGANPEMLSQQNLAPGTYYVQVYRVGGSTNYSLQLNGVNSTSVNKLTSVANGLYPSDSGIVNIKTTYGAKGDGVTDDTKAIQAAIKNYLGYNGKPKIIYFPKGTYLVSKTLEWKDSTGEWDSYLSFVGESENGTVIKLKDNAMGFKDLAHPKAVIYTASIGSDKGNRAHNNFFENLTVDTGKGNFGAIGIDYLANNRASIRDVTIRSGDGKGSVGLNMTRGWTGPALIEGVQIDGFDYGIRTVGPEYSITFKDIVLNNQKVVGIDNLWNVLSIDGLTSHNAVPVIRNRGSNPNDNRSLVTLLNATLTGGSASNVAIENNAGEIYARKITTSGYQAALKNGTTVIPGKTIAEYITSASSSLFPSAKTSLNLLIETAPTFHDTNFNNWASVVAYGAIPNDSKDDTAAIQAALDSGKTTVYFPTGVYNISSTLHVRGNVKKIAGMESNLQSTGNVFSNSNRPTPLLRFETGSASSIILDQISIGGTGAGLVAVEQATAKTLVIEDASLGGAIASYRSTQGAGKLFLEDVVGSRWRFDYPQNIWARQLNAEGWEKYPGNENVPKIRNNGANLWILGLKTEVPTPVIETTGGGRTELLGGLLYPTRAVPANVPAFINNESSLSLVYAVSAYASDRNYTIQVKETRGGITKLLQKGSVLGRDNYGSVMPLYVGYK